MDQLNLLKEQLYKLTKDIEYNAKKTGGDCSPELAALMLIAALLFVLVENAQAKIPT